MTWFYSFILFYLIILFHYCTSYSSIFYLLLHLQFYIILSLTSMTHHMSCFTLRPNTDALYLLSADSSNISLSSSQSNFCFFFASFRIILQGRQWEGHPSTEKGALREARKYMHHLPITRSIFFSFLSISIPIRIFYLTKITLSFLFWTQ